MSAFLGLLQAGGGRLSRMVRGCSWQRRTVFYKNSRAGVFDHTVFYKGHVMKLTGGCYCKGIRYSYEGDIKASLQCHCRECQYITGGHPNAIVIFDLEGFNYEKGTPSSFKRTDLERPVTRFFCPTCGTAIGTQTPMRPGAMVVKVGTLDDPSVYKPQIAIFTVDKQAFHHIPDDVKAFERRPG